MEISIERLTKIHSTLPNAVKIQRRLLLPVDSMVAFGGQQSKVGLAAVCLRDAAEFACDVVYALEQAYVNLAYYREECPNAPDEPAAVLLAKSTQMMLHYVSMPQGKAQQTSYWPLKVFKSQMSLPLGGSGPSNSSQRVYV